MARKVAFLLELPDCSSTEAARTSTEAFNLIIPSLLTQHHGRGEHGLAHQGIHESQVWARASLRLLRKCRYLVVPPMRL